MALRTQHNNHTNPAAFFAFGPQEGDMTGRPDAVGGIFTSAGEMQVALSWVAPAEGGSPISDCVGEYKQSSDGTYLVCERARRGSLGSPHGHQLRHAREQPGL